MSLSTLLEAAKYLDYLDSSGSNHQPNQQLQYQSPQTQLIRKRSVRRPRASKKNGMVAMSLPSSGLTKSQGVPIPMVTNEANKTTSLSSSYNTGSPLSSFASTALLCSKASEITSNSSSAASSLSSSDSSSSCGEILMGDNDFGTIRKHGKRTHIHHSSGNQDHHNYHLTHQSDVTQSQSTSNQLNGASNQSVTRYIAATSAGPKLVTVAANTTIANSSIPIEGSLRAGRVVQAAYNNHKGLASTPECSNTNSFIGDNISGSPTSCQPFIMARVQPMILNPLAQSAPQSIMAFQQATASSPTSSSSSYSRHRELHKTLEKNRRAHLRHCFELLKAELPSSECVDRKTSHINIIKSAIRYVLTLREQEANLDSELQRLTKIKNELTDKLSKMRNNQSPSPQQPAPEQQLSFLLSQSKIDWESMYCRRYVGFIMNSLDKSTYNYVNIWKWFNLWLNYPDFGPMVVRIGFDNKFHCFKLD